MKVAVIPTLSMLEYDTGGIHMMLPEPWMREQRYRDYYKSAYGFKIFDNGEAEGMRMQPADLMKTAIELGADEVVVPDHLGDCDKTIELARNFVRAARKYPGIQYMGVLQGNSYGEYIKCLQAFQDLSYIKTIGVPRNICKVIGSKWARVALMDMIVDQELHIQYEFHALGATPWMREVVCLSETPMRSIDTSLPFVMALDKRSITIDEYIDRQPDFFVREPNHYERELCLDNISTYRDWAGDYPHHTKTPVGQV